MVRRGTLESKKHLHAGDVLIEPDLGDISAASFTRSKDAIRIGEEATRKLAEETRAVQQELKKGDTGEDNEKDIFEFRGMPDNVPQFFAVDLGHDQVEEHDVRGEVGQEIERLKPVPGRDHLMTAPGEQLPRERQDHPVVVHHGAVEIVGPDGRVFSSEHIDPDAGE